MKIVQVCYCNSVCASALQAGCTSNKSNADGGNNKAQASGDFKVEVIAKGSNMTSGKL